MEKKTLEAGQIGFKLTDVETDQWDPDAAAAKARTKAKNTTSRNARHQALRIKSNEKKNVAT